MTPTAFLYEPPALRLAALFIATHITVNAPGAEVFPAVAMEKIVYFFSC